MDDASDQPQPLKNAGPCLSPRRFRRSLRAALHGLAVLWAQPNARIQLGVGLAAIAVGVWIGLDATRWAILTLTIAMVLCLEALNTAIEHAIDLACPRIDPLARSAKDIGAAAVLIASIASLVVASLILIPGVWQKLFG